MEPNEILFIGRESVLPDQNSDPKLCIDDSFACTSCSYPIEILKIDDKENTITFKCLNPNEIENEKTIQISEYLDLMKKNTYLYSECSLCHKKQNESKETLFLYCIKCDAIFCPDCRDKHLETNGKKHHDLSEEFIIKNNERSIKCLLHPKEKNLAFCLKCNTHICKSCMKSKKHVHHKKNHLMEVAVTDEIKNILNNIINIYEIRIKQLNKEKNKKEKELLDDKKCDVEKKEKEKNDKIKENQEKLKKELIENEKLLTFVIPFYYPK